jgi:uncharacterized surface protein with fasciclin (FAS1) repeats
MRRIISLHNFNCLVILSVIVIFQSCRDNEYYDRPDSLEPAIYKQLEEKGNFTDYLICLDRANYKDVLNGAGYFTVFAPTDEAFANFYSKNSFKKAEDIPLETVKKIVAYSIVYNSYEKYRLDDYQSTDSSGWVSDMAFKRRTAYYKWVYPDTIDNVEMFVVDMNAVGPEESPAGTHRSEDYNNKHIPYFTSEFFARKNLSAYDYNYFYPETEFSGFNVVDAKVTEADLLAENGVIHVVDKVILPLPSLEELIESNPQYSEFKRILDKYLIEYNLAGTVLHQRYELATGNRPDIYIKEYPTLNFAPNCENFLMYGLGEYYDAQINGWTIFVPTNQAIQDFYNTKFLQFYGSLDEMPQQLISEFINAHMFRTTVWPSKFNITVNPFGEPARFDPELNVKEKKIGSNGIFYGVDKVQETDGFYTLLGDIYLNPEYSLMLQALYTTGLYAVVKNTNLKFTIFMIPNKVFEDFGFSYSDVLNTWYLNNELLGSNASQALSRIINLHIIVNKEFEDFSGTGYIQTYGDEYIRYKDGNVWAAGNLQENDLPVIDDKIKNIRSNGISHVFNKNRTLIYYSTKNIGEDISELCNSSENSTHKKFIKYLERSANSLSGFLYNTSTMAITNLSIADPHTILIPSDTAIDGAVRDGYLPPIGATLFSEAEQDMVAKFIWYHCLKGMIVVPENPVSGDLKTLYKTVQGSTYVKVNNEGGNIMFFDNYGNTANVINPNDLVTSRLGNNAIIYFTDNYLRY